MKIIKNQMCDVLLVVHDHYKVNGIRTPLCSLAPGETLSVAFGINGTTPCVPRIFGASYPRDEHGCMDFDGDPEYKELKVSTKRTTEDSFVVLVENNTDEYINPGFVIVF